MLFQPHSLHSDDFLQLRFQQQEACRKAVQEENEGQESCMHALAYFLISNVFFWVEVWVHFPDEGGRLARGTERG